MTLSPVTESFLLGNIGAIEYTPSCQMHEKGGKWRLGEVSQDIFVKKCYIDLGSALHLTGSHWGFKVSGEHGAVRRERWHGLVKNAAIGGRRAGF